MNKYTGHLLVLPTPYSPTDSAILPYRLSRTPLQTQPYSPTDSAVLPYRLSRTPLQT